MCALAGHIGEGGESGVLATTQVSTPFGQFACFEDDLITAQLRTYGAHQRSDLAMLLRFVRRGDQVVDVGAHIGTFAVPIGHRVGPEGVVYAFEPVTAHFELLCQNAATNALTGIVVPIKAIVTCSKASLRLDYRRDNTGMARFREGAASDPPAKRVRLDEWRHSLSEQPKVAVVKVDVEGMELDVLQSGRELIRSQRPVLLFEVERRRGDRHSLAELDRFVRGMGYHMFINLSRRNVSDDTFRLARLKRLTPFAILRCPLLDVVAVQPGSPRYPPAYVVAPITQAVMLSRLGKAAPQYLSAAWRKLRHACS